MKNRLSLLYKSSKSVASATHIQKRNAFERPWACWLTYMKQAKPVGNVHSTSIVCSLHRAVKSYQTLLLYSIQLKVRTLRLIKACIILHKYLDVNYGNA